MTLAKVVISTASGVPVVRLIGEVDMGNARDVLDQIVAATPNQVTALVLDLSETTYLDSRGVNMVLELADRLALHQQQMIVSVPAESVLHRLLQITHVEEKVALSHSLEDAVSRAQEIGRRS